MISFWITTIRLATALRRAWGQPGFRTTVVLIATTLLSGTLFYTSVEGWHWLDALYFSVATISTVGYGDFVPVTNSGKVFAIIFIIVGIGLFIALVTEIARALIGSSDETKDG
jgi:voltage-gated potassium channel Kch